MKRGRKQDDTLPPSRSREIQRAFRQRRSDYIHGLEERVSQLENEVDDVLSRHGEALRYNTAEVVAARSASRKKPKNKSKHNLAPFVDVDQLAEHSARSSSTPIAAAVETALVMTPSTAGSCHELRADLSPATHYLLRDLNDGPSSAQSTPVYSKGPFTLDNPMERKPEFTRSPEAPPSILCRRSKPLLQLLEANYKTNADQQSPKSPFPNSHLPQHLSANEYQTPSSQLEMFMGIDAVVPSPDVSSQLLSSLELHHEMRGPSSSCSLPTLVSDSSPPSDQLSVGGFHAFQSSHDVHSTPYTFRPPSSQLPDRFNQCSYAFVTSPDSSSPNVASYQESPLSLFRSRHPMSDQSALHHESLSTLIAIASTRLDHFEASKADCNYQAVALQPSPVLHDLSMSPDSSQNSEASRESFLDLRQDEHVRTATSSSASSEPRELESHSQCDYSHSRLASPRALSSANLFVDDIDGRQTPVCLSICSENTTKEWHDLNVIGFPKGYQAVKYSE